MNMQIVLIREQQANSERLEVSLRTAPTEHIPDIENSLRRARESFVNLEKEKFA